MKHLNILFLGGAKRVSMARHFKRAAATRGIAVSIFGSEISQDVPLVIEGDIIDNTRWSDADALQRLSDVCREHEISVVVPFVDNGVAFATRLAEASEGRIFAPCSAPAVSERMFDKVLAAADFESAGLPIPATWHPSIPADDMLPLIAKPRCGSASKGIILIDEASQLDEIYHPSYLIQKRFDKRDEITVDCYRSVVDGHIKAIVPRLRNEVAGGEVVRTTVFHDAQVSALAEKVILSLGLTGAVTVQLLRDLRSGILYVMEVNPRLGGGAVAAIGAGADLTGMILDDALGNPQPAITDYNNVMVARYLDEVVFPTHNI